ncbi:MAG: N-6 DNA methylase [Proteobacteria bacterium]|nr:N-6 DNA methylase [Pseudomonadota bacterium]
MDEAARKISNLVDRFQNNLDAYRSPAYNETQLRIEFIDPFFEALGWDVANKSGYAEQYKDVIHEDAIKVSGATKAPDYCFRIGGGRKFFLETKKPSVDIKDQAGPSYQLRRYAWSAKLPISILTNFAELAIYDCRIRPKPGDKTSIGRVRFYPYTEYIKFFEEIYNLLSKESVLKGSFDKFAETDRQKRGTTEVDSEFLKEIENWREILAKDIARRNPKLTVRELNYAVQLTIDRIIFLRMCEDRGIESYGQIQSLLNGTNTYHRLREYFYHADGKYNSGLFDFKTDQLTPELKIDDHPLKDIFKNLYYPDSPYEFSVLGVDILGHVYEQFLGKVIRLTGGHQAKVEEKPEVRKAGGVYYTPTYIVDYIVKNTVGKLCEGKRPRQISSLRILDPACGSGSFLLGAYQYLLDYHRDWYQKDGSKKHIKEIYQGRGGQWYLTIQEKKRILLNNIYGVDIDPQAVEVTKLSLLLKVLEGEYQDSLERQMKLFKERALPDLVNNIKCGNSLIGSEYFTEKLFADKEERDKIGIFDWESEFPEEIKMGGFDCVIGNPPWGADFSDHELEYLRNNNQEIIVRMIDSFMYFVYQGCKKVKPGGRFGMILPDVILYQNDNEKLREFIMKNFKIDKLLNMGNVFEKVTRPASIIILEKGHYLKHKIEVADISDISKTDKPAAIIDRSHFESILQEDIFKIPGQLFITANPTRYAIWRKIENIPYKLLQDLVDKDGIQRGVSPDLKKAFIVDSKTIREWGLEKNKLRRVLTGGKQVKRYFIDHQELWLIYTTSDDNFRELPNIRTYIDQFKIDITCREVREKKHPIYSLHRPRKEEIFLKKKKILGVITEDEIIVALDEAQTFVTDGLYLFGVREFVNINYLMAVLNSKLFVFIYRLLALEEGRVLAQVKPTILNQLPIRTINPSNLIEKGKHDRIVALVDVMAELQENYYSAKTGDKKIAIERQIGATDHQINQLIYELYDLSEEEIKIVEDKPK